MLENGGFQNECEPQRESQACKNIWKLCLKMVVIKINTNLNERALVASCKASPALPCRLSHLDRIISHILGKFVDVLLIVQSK